MTRPSISLIEKPQGWVVKIERKNASVFVGPVAPVGATLVEAKEGAKIKLKFLNHYLPRAIIKAEAEGTFDG